MRIRTETTVGIFILIAIGIFFYMSFQIGALRFDRGRYNTYTVYFHDISGLAKKADVKIAGVKVGWVDDVDLVNSGQQVKATVKIFKEYALHSDAYGVIRQEGLLGSKYLEIMSGDPLAPILAPGGVLMKPSRDPVAIDELLYQFKSIAGNVEEITATFKDVFGGPDGKHRLQETIQSFNEAATHVASFAQAIDQLILRNQGNVDGIMSDFKDVAHDLKAQIPLITGDIRRLSEKLAVEVLPAVEQSVERVSRAIDRDFNRMASRIETTTGPMEQVLTKINDGRGILGKLVNDDEAYRDLRVAVQGLKNYFAQIEKLSVVFDTHFESMYGRGDRFCFQDAKGYFNVRIHPMEDYFYLAGIVGAQSGRIFRYQKFTERRDCKGCILDPCDPLLSYRDQLKFAPNKFKLIREFDTTLFNLQFGKIYKDLAFRFGLFESSFGAGIDYDIPFNTDAFRWVTTFEAFDFRGRNRIDDDRPHLKWLNKVFLTKSLYFVFGADDFISRHNKNAFFGAGIRFADDDIKYLLSKVNMNC